MVPFLPTKVAAAVAGGNGAAQMIAVQVAQHAVLAHGDHLAVEVIILGRSPTVVAHAGPIPPGVAALLPSNT
jgi:hypothetical protein